MIFRVSFSLKWETFWTLSLGNPYIIFYHFSRGHKYFFLVLTDFPKKFSILSIYKPIGGILIFLKVISRKQNMVINQARDLITFAAKSP